MLKLLAIILLCVPVYAGDVSLVWDHSPSEGVAGYKVYYGRTPRTYDHTLPITYMDRCTIYELSPGTYYFAVTAFDENENESGYSNEVSATVTEPLPELDVVGGASSAQWFGVVVSVTTNRNTSATLRYALQEEGELNWITTIVTEGARKRTHTALLNQVIVGQSYYYQWELTDSDGNVMTHGSSFIVK